MSLVILRALTFIGVAGAFSQSIFAATITQTYSGSFPATITGTLPNQNTALLEDFTLASDGNLTVTTTSYATGGLEPDLLLFNSAGHFVAAGSPFGAADSATGIIGDMQLTASNLPAGMYTLALTDFLLNQSLTATNLSDGFTDNSGNGLTFVDANGNTRSGDFAFTIGSAAVTSTPEPATYGSVAALLGVLALRIRKIKKTSGTGYGAGGIR